MRSCVLLPALLPIALAAQTTFAPIGAKWTYKQGSWAGPDTTIMVIEVLGDTVIIGRTCSKLTITDGWLGCHEIPRFLTVSNDSLFYLAPGSNEFHLLFRWNALIGESWSTPIEQTGYLDTLDWTVNDTGHVLIDGMSLRRVNAIAVPRAGALYSESCGEVIERLGSPLAPFTWIFFACDGEVFQGLRCYEDPEISWQNPQFAQCALGVGIEDPSSSQRLIVRPTLATSGEPIQLSVDQGALDVFDATGRTVLSRSVLRNTFIQLERCGTYLLRFTGHEGSVATQRIVVMP